MQKIIYTSQIKEYEDSINQKIIEYLKEGQSETIESFSDFSIIAFDAYDITNIFKHPEKMIIYVDKDDLLFLCGNENVYRMCEKYVEPTDTNEHAIYLFFSNLLKGNTKYLEDLEDRISKVDANIISETNKNSRNKIMSLRFEVLRLKKYYEQFDFIFEELGVNDNELFTKTGLKYFRILKNRTYRFLSMTINLKDYIIQVREAYQAQMDIEQNKLMKLFTIVTSIFLPLTLLVGWYGMNLQMPEFTWKYGYLFVIGLSIIICLLWYIIFKKKKWL